MNARRSGLGLVVILAGLALAGCPGNSAGGEVPQRDEVPPVPPEGTAGVSIGPRVACDEALADPPASAKKKSAATVGARKDLALLLPPKSAGGKAVAKSTDLKKLSIRIAECVRPRPELDIAALDLPPDVPRTELPADVQPLWDKRAAIKTELLASQVKLAKLDRKRDECERERCAKKVCIDDLRARAAEEAKSSKTMLVTLEDGLAKKLETATPNGGTSLALGYLRERAAKRGDGDPTAEMKPAIAAYEAAKGKSAVDTDIGWFARYRLGLVYDDAGLGKQAKAEWTALAGAAPRPRGTAEVAFRLGEHEADPARAADAFKRALASISTDEAPSFRAPFTYRLLRAETSAGRFADAAATAVALLDLARDDDDQVLMAETMEELAFALDSIGDSSNPLPTLPAEEWTKVGAMLTREAFARFDPASAAATQKALGNSNAATQSPADVAARMNAVARSCGFLAIGSDGGEIDVRVDTLSEGRAKVTAKKKTGDAQIEAAAACIARRAPAYFVGAPSSATATVALLK